MCKVVKQSLRLNETFYEPTFLLIDQVNMLFIFPFEYPTSINVFSPDWGVNQLLHFQIFIGF